MTKFRTRPKEVEARQLTVHNMAEIEAWCRGSVKGSALPISEQVIDFNTNKGEIRVELGDWVVKDGNGKFSKYDADDFKNTYIEHSESSNGVKRLFETTIESTNFTIKLDKTSSSKNYGQYQQKDGMVFNKRYHPTELATGELWFSGMELSHTSGNCNLPNEVRDALINHGYSVEFTLNEDVAEKNLESKAESTAKEYRYAMVNRPFGIGTAPKDIIRTEERPAQGQPHYDYARHGIVVYGRQLTPVETKGFELSPILEGDAIVDAVNATANELKDYAARYVEMDKNEPKDFANKVNRAVRDSSMGYPPSIGNVEQFNQLVVDKLNELSLAKEAAVAASYQP